jgi:iron complex transport system ATP-binding protein
MKPLLEAESLCVRRGASSVLHDVCLRLERGQLWALLGRNGSGKSTLLAALIGAIPIDSGKVFLEGRKLYDCSRMERARAVALVGCELTRDTSLSVRALVELGRLPHRTRFGLSTHDTAAVEAALKDTDCLALAARPLFALSDGERQRVLWARALAQQPSLLLLDEATGHLDLSHRERTLLRTRDFVARGGAALAVLHDLDLAVRHCTHVAVLDQGRLVASGAPRTILNTALLREVFGVDARIEHSPEGPHLRIFGVHS